MSELNLLAQMASGGVSIGHIQLRSPNRAIHSAAAGMTLAEAVEVTIRELRSLQAGVDREAADIVQFQIELLEDPTLTAEALVAVAAGADPVAAFRQGIATHLRVYEDAADDYLRARAADVRDLRDRVLRALSGARAGAQDIAREGAILVVDDLTPTGFLAVDWTRAKGAATINGSPHSHAAILARSRGIPMIVGLQGADKAKPGAACILDADAGLLILEPGPPTLAHYRERAEATAVRNSTERAHADRPAVTRDGRAIRVYVNVDAPDSLRQVPREWFDGVGLVRTELLLDTSSGVPDAATQAACYRPLFDWSAGRPTTIRLLDAGGDKPIPGLTLGNEANPFLGMRGVRLLLRTPEVLRSQLAAILDAAAGRSVRIMIPMITVPQEFSACRAILDALVAERGAPRAPIQLGMMVETPAAALTIERFDAEFFSIGTNDLVQYVMAAGRDQRELQYLQTATAPAVLDLIARVAQHGHSTGKEVGVCGDDAFQPGALQALLQAGISSVSVPAQRGPGVKSLIRTMVAGDS